MLLPPELFGKWMLIIKSHKNFYEVNNRGSLQHIFGGFTSIHIRDVPRNTCQALGEYSLNYFEWNVLYQHGSSWVFSRYVVPDGRNWRKKAHTNDIISMKWINDIVMAFYSHSTYVVTQNVYLSGLKNSPRVWFLLINHSLHVSPQTEIKVCKARRTGWPSLRTSVRNPNISMAYRLKQGRAPVLQPHV
jgi:hypothetical protein